ncbi:hypothetical protein J6590_010187 [Homalodisca vitripennis]|nr:hypothetical protein J6590_010187 [Homalodisca vitripennis]
MSFANDQPTTGISSILHLPLDNAHPHATEMRLRFKKRNWTYFDRDATVAEIK